MAVPKSRLQANAKYRSKTYDVISISVKKGKREEYKQEAELRGMSLAGIIQNGVDEYIANHPVDTESNCAIVSAEK